MPIVRGKDGWPVLLTDDHPLVRDGIAPLLSDDHPLFARSPKPEAPSRVIGKPDHVAITTAEAAALLQAVDPHLTLDQVADLLTGQNIPRFAAWDLQSVQALADSLPELRRSGKAKRGLA
jgi:hypothetical protein